ncbi:hypothetical protein H5993_07740 [Lactobacillus alvi]|uniref:Uncharacterized protein n=1 Tax=Limosilactobacillus alvi TaxID=990412 RepID=A0ABS2EQY9_9LACO|nr:hypothetical protein [Limosilactobacillus alvi]
MIETSDLECTIIHPGWFVNGPVDYEVTEPFGGHDVSIKSIAVLVEKLIVKNLYLRERVGSNTSN